MYLNRWTIVFNRLFLVGEFELSFSSQGETPLEGEKATIFASFSYTCPNEIHTNWSKTVGGVTEQTNKQADRKKTNTHTHGNI